MRPQRMGRDFPTKQQHTCKASPVINNPHQSGPYVATHNNHPKSIVYIKIHSWCSIGEDDGPPLQYSCLENPMHGGAWWATIYGISKSRTRLRNFTSPHLTMPLPFTLLFWVQVYTPFLCFLSREDPLAFVRELVWWC